MSMDNGLMSTDKRLMSADKRLMSMDNTPMSTDKCVMSMDNWLMSPDNWLMSTDNALLSTDKPPMSADASSPQTPFRQRVRVFTGSPSQRLRRRRSADGPKGRSQPDPGLSQLRDLPLQQVLISPVRGPVTGFVRRRVRRDQPSDRVLKRDYCEPQRIHGEQPVLLRPPRFGVGMIDRKARFADEMAGVEGVPERIKIEDSERDADLDADIICTATSAASPVLRAGDVAPGTHINAIGSFTPEMVEIDPALVAGSRVVVDQREAAMAEAGEVIAAVRSGLIREKDLIELGQIVNGAAPGRTSEEEITLFKSVGLAVQDLCAGARAVAEARRSSLGIELELQLSFRTRMSPKRHTVPQERPIGLS
jgi:hypothetical protein